MSELDLDGIRRENEERLKLEGAAEAAPWGAFVDRDFARCVPQSWGAGNLSEHWRQNFVNAEEWQGLLADHAFIAHARNHPAGPVIAALLAEIERITKGR